MSEQTKDSLQSQLREVAKNIHMIEHPDRYSAELFEDTFGVDQDNFDISEIARDYAMETRVRSDFVNDQNDMVPHEYRIVITNGGPYIAIEGFLDNSFRPINARLRGIWSNENILLPLRKNENHYMESLLAYAQRFVFGV